MVRFALLAASISGFVSVALGAFGAHGLQKRLADLPDAAQRLGWWNTAAQYQMYHALALGLVAVVASRALSVHGQLPTSVTVACVGMVLGTLLFCGSLYAMTLSGVRVLGAVTPLGGVGFLVGWVALGCAAWFATRPA